MAERYNEGLFGEIVYSDRLAAHLYDAVEDALASGHVVFTQSDLWQIAKQPLDVIRNIQDDYRGKLLKRFIEQGPAGMTGRECLTAVEFMFSFMINRCKGDLAELLALSPVLDLLRGLERKGRIPANWQLYWGDAVQEPVRVKPSRRRGKTDSQRVAKGADGLICSEVIGAGGVRKLDVLGVVEVKSMYRSQKRVAWQIGQHADRLSQGVTLNGHVWHADDLAVNRRRLLRLVVVPSQWKLSRVPVPLRLSSGQELLVAEHTTPKSGAHVKRLNPGMWRIALAWSEEALEQAAYSLTIWMMHRLEEETGLDDEDTFRDRLYQVYYHCRVDKRQRRLLTKLCNAFDFGYQFGVDEEKLLVDGDRT